MLQYSCRSDVNDDRGERRAMEEGSISPCAPTVSPLILFYFLHKN